MGAPKGNNYAKGALKPFGFKPGVSGNPGGRVKNPPLDVIKYARLYTIEAIKTLAIIMGNPKFSPGARVSAAVAILDRGYGKAPQTVTLHRDEDYKDLSDAELIAIASGAIAGGDTIDATTTPINGSGGGDPAAAPGDPGQPH